MAKSSHTQRTERHEHQTQFQLPLPRAIDWTPDKTFNAQIREHLSFARFRPCAAEIRVKLISRKCFLFLPTLTGQVAPATFAHTSDHPGSLFERELYAPRLRIRSRSPFLVASRQPEGLAGSVALTELIRMENHRCLIKRGSSAELRGHSFTVVNVPYLRSCSRRTSEGNRLRRSSHWRERRRPIRRRS